MKLQIVDKVNKKDWESLINQFNGNLYHSIEWANIQMTKNRIPQYFKYMEQNECIGIALGFISKSKFPLSLLSKSLSFDTTPCVLNDDPILLYEMVREIRDFSKKTKYISLYLDSYDSRNSLDNLEELGFNLIHRIEFVIDLTKTEEELWNNMESNFRKKIRKGIKNNIIIEENGTINGLKQLVSLMDQSLARHGVYHFSEEKIVNIKKLIDFRLAKLFTAKYNGDIVSVILVTLYNKKGYYMYGGNSDMGLKCEASRFLIWHTILDIKRMGFTSYTIGGVPKESEYEGSPQHGLYMFKKEFGGEKRYCYSGAIENLNKTRNNVVNIIRSFKG